LTANYDSKSIDFETTTVSEKVFKAMAGVIKTNTKIVALSWQFCVLHERQGCHMPVLSFSVLNFLMKFCCLKLAKA